MTFNTPNGEADTMPQLTTEFQSLPEEYQHVIGLAQDKYKITVAPLQLLVGGWSGAVVYLVSVSSNDTRSVEHCILKLDHKGKSAKSDEVTRHNIVMNKSTSDFARAHIAELVFDRVEYESAIAIFYRIAGQSLLNYRPLSSYGQQSQLETIFMATNSVLLAEWNGNATFDQAIHPQKLLAKWLGFRLDAGGNIERFLESVCQVNPGIAGFLIGGNVFPNPLIYARKPEYWGKARFIDVATGFIHGDLNTNNILVKFSENQDVLEGYYLIDFALFKEQMPLLYDQRYLELSYLILAMSQVSFAKCINLLMVMAEVDIVDPHKVPIEMSGVSAVIASARSAFAEWVKENHPSLHDDLWGQYWLAGVAAGLSYCHKPGMGQAERLTGLVYAAANLKRYAALFGIPTPAEGRQLYDAAQFQPDKSLGEATPTVESGSSRTPAAPNNLPRQLTGFIGRETELTSLKVLLSDVRNRLVAIVAPGGMGKTRLALEAAGQIYQEYSQGVFFVALDRLSSADLIVQAVAEVLPISLSSKEDPKSRIIDYLRDKTTLLVMDNFEHVLDGVVFVQEILEAAPRAQVLATSRAKLNLMSETIFNIGGLTVDEDSPEKNSAIQLFAQSARRTQPKFELNDAVLPAVTRICRIIEGMPLAIVLAAAWIDTLSVDEIAAEIEKSIDILETEKRDLPDRQHSVRAVIESSWNLVEATAQNLLKRLAVFRGGFTRAVAQEAAGASLRGLSQLVDKALLRHDPDTGRYSIHELLRQYAEEQLALSAEAERSAHEAHAKYFADFMKTRGVHLHDQHQKAALLEIEADFDNIRVAWNYWADKQDASRLIEFISALWLFFEVRGSFTPAIQFFGDAAKKLTANEPDIVCARAQLRARQAWFTALIGLPDEGLLMAQESVNTLSQFSKQDITVETFHCVNINAIFLNKNEIVAQISQEMMARANRSGDIWEQGWALVWWAYALVLQRQIGEALQAGQEALAIFERLDNPFGSSVASGIILGATSMAIGDISAAKTHYLRGAQAAEAIDYLRLLQISYDNLGTVALLEGDIQQAQQFFLKSLRISQECGQTREMLASLRDLANVYIARGDLESALQLLAIVLNHSVSDQNSLNRPERLRDEAEKLRAQIETRLDPSRYRTTWQTGQRQHIAEVVKQILI
jgi:predicted ATPase